jgi:hypothetical protein
MGILDDAIKEHLDLKRRRGADPSEVEQLEREALGPVRRSPQATEEAPPDQDVLDHEGGGPMIFDEEADEVYTQPTELHHPEVEQAEYEDEAEHEPFAEDDSEKSWSHDSAESWEAEQPLAPEAPAAPAAETPAPAAPPPAPAEPHEHGDHPDGETVEYDVEAEEIKRGEKDEDVLEETPEFLQDTPDHDRLWFEQRPPKDFDFDK